jgi:hypothetical protein
MIKPKPIFIFNTFLDGENMFIHLGIGKPYQRSYRLLKCEKVTSSCAKRRNGFVFTAKYVDKPLHWLENHIPELQNPIHEYRYGYRVYKVYPYTEELWKLLDTLMQFSYNLYRYCYNGDVIETNYCYNKVLSDLSEKCSKGIDSCFEAIAEWAIYIESIRSVKREAGRKAFITRLRKSHERCLPILQKYFSDVLNYLSFRERRFGDPAVYTNDSVGYSNCFNGVFNYLKKFFDEDRARRYADRMCRGFSTVFLLARDGIIVLDLRIHEEPIDIYAMECVVKPTYAMVKLVNVTQDFNMMRVEWVALLGLDKATNQIFIHYVPRTFLFRDLETCRKWVMGLVDNRGRPIEQDYELIEA